MDEKRRIHEVLRDHTDELMAIPGVVAVAVGESCGKQCIRVFVAHRSSELLSQVPGKIDGFQILIEESGQFQALDD